MNWTSSHSQPNPRSRVLTSEFQWVSMRAATSHGYISTNKLNCSAEACPADGSKGPCRKKPWWQFWFCSYMGNNKMVTGSHPTPVTHNPLMLSFCCIACLPSWQSTKRHVDPGCLHPYIHPFDTIYWKWSSRDATQLGPVLGVYAYISHPTFSSEAILPLQEQQHQGHQKEGISFQDCTHLIKSQFLPPKRHSSTLPTFWGREQSTLRLDKAMESACCLIEIIILRPSWITGNFCW